MKLCAALALLLGGLFAACGGPDSVLDGTWKYAPSELDKMHGAMRESLKDAILSFKDGTITTPGGQSNGYEVVEADGKNLTLKLTDGKRKGATIAIVVDGESLSMTANGMTIEYVRAD